MSEKSAPAEGVEDTVEDATGEVKQPLGSAGVHAADSAAGEHRQPNRPQRQSR